MKSILKLGSAVVLLAMACLTTGNVSAQQTVATWYVNLQTNTPPPNPFTNNTANPNVVVYPMQKGPGIGEPSGTAEYGGNAWTNAGVADSEANSIANGLYLTYAIQAAPGYTISFTTNVLYYHVSGTGPNHGELQYSTDGINYSDISAMNYAGGGGGSTASALMTNVLSGVPSLLNVPSTVTNYFRIVNWGATSTAGTWYVYDNPPIGTNGFVVIGAVNPIPPATTIATWYPTGLTVASGGTPPAPFTNNTASANVTVTPFMKGSGIGNVTTTGVYGGNTWTNAGLPDSEANSIAHGLYLTYAVQAATGYTISFFTNAIFYHNSATGPVNGELQYSTDGINYSDLTSMTYAPLGTSETLVMTNNLSTFSYLQNVASTTTNFFRIVNWGATGTAGTWYLASSPPAGSLVGTNSFVIVGGLTSLFGVIAPTNVVIAPTNQTVNAGQTVGISVSQTGSPTSNFWYHIIGSTTNLISGVTSSTLSMTNVLGANSGGYFVILTNASGSATSAVATLTVIDPIIQAEPSSVQGLVDGTVQFSVTASGSTPLSYQWYYSDTNGNIIAPVNNGMKIDGSGDYGATNSILTLTNLQTTDLTNFVVVVTNIYGAVTSTVASFLSSTVTGTLPATQGVLALWDFDGSQFTNTLVNPNSILNPIPFIGYGTATAVGTPLVPGTSPFSGATDPNDVGFDPNSIPPGYVFTPYGFDQPSPNFSWGTEDYPINGTNKMNGVQFNVSTVGARNIHVSYDARVSSTASDYFRLQYTTNGTAWVDYPASTSFSGLSSATGNGGYYTFNYNLVGFPGVDNNPNFGFRVVSEYQNSATYGIGTTDYWVAVANTYTSGDNVAANTTGGTVTYDLVAITGDAITNNNNVPPTLGAFANMPYENITAGTNGTFMGYVTNMVDTNTLVIPFTASSPQMAASVLNFSAQSLDTVSAGTFSRSVNPMLSVANTGGNNFTLSINFGGNYIPDPMDAAPILLTVTDTNGLSASSWFLLTALAINQPPTNSLTSLGSTNMLANTSLSIPFFVGSSSNNPSSNFTFTVTSANNTVLPAANIVISGNTNTGNMVLTLTPAANEVGNAVFTVGVDDNDVAEPRTTTATVACVVRPNTNVVAIDYFNYDNSGSLDSIAPSYWSHLSGVSGQLQDLGGVAQISDGNTENLQAKLLGSPYLTNSAVNKVLYYSCTIDMTTLPYTNGSYVLAFNDGSGTTANVEGLLVATTNGAAANSYRLGVDNIVGADGTDAQIFPQDLAIGTTYNVIVQLVLSNGFSTLWINPTNQASQSVRDTSPAASQTNLYNIANIEMRESGTSEGIMNVGALTVGTTFNSVFYPPQANPETVNITENSTGNVLKPLTNDGGSGLTITGVTTPAEGTATISNGTNIIYSITHMGYTGADSFNYTVTDDLGETSSSTVTLNIAEVPPVANPATYTVLENSANNVLSVLTNDVLETPGGTLGLTSVSETDGNGTASISSTNVIFTPTASYIGAATINYTINDGLGGTSSSTITVNVLNLTPIPIGAAAVSGGNLVLTWSNPAFSLQTSTNVVGPYVTIPGATSPYTNTMTTNAAGFYRLVH